MTSEQFTYWLQGFMETADPETIDAKQTQIIKDHLALVFTKETPSYSEEKPKQEGIVKADDWYKKILEENNLPIGIMPSRMRGPIYLGSDWPQPHHTYPYIEQPITIC